MDKILYGVIKSNHPTAVKKAVVSRISTAAATNTDEEICINIIKTSLDILVQPNSSKDEINLVSIVFKNWMKHHMDVAFQYLNKEILQKSSSKLKCEEKTLKLKTLRCCIKTVSTFYDISKSPIKDMLKKYLFSTLTQCESLECLSLCCEFLLENHFFLPEQMEFESKIEITKTIITVISNSPYIFQNTAGADLSPTEKHLKVVSDFLSVCIHHNEKLMRHAAGYLFKLLSSKDKHPSISLVCILPSLKLNVLETDMEGLMMTAVSNEPLTATLGHMVDWICFPNDTLPVDDWVINFMKYLIKYRKFECLFSVVDSKIKQICNMMFFPVMRKGAVSVLTFMLISYLHSPEPFHQAAVIFPRLLKHLKLSADSNSTSKILVELIHTLMFHFPGYPDVYSPLLAAVEGYPKPSEENMRAWLNASFAIPRAESSDLHFEQVKSDTGKIGLENLGNTCYMNSVLQALFNLPCIKKELLSNTYAAVTQMTSRNLQHVFALLHASERPAIAPKEFYKVSRPSWFLEGSQQDCSEYLKHLLDKLQQENTESPDKINGWCTGELNATVECLNCRTLSLRKETFNDLPLSFQSPSSETSPGGVCTLKGGDSSESINQKMNVKMDTETQEINMEFSQEPSVSISANMETSSRDENITLVDMLNSYFLPEELSENNKYFCEKCASLQSARKYLEMEKLPKYLILTLKRFTFNIQTQKRSKILTTLQYPMNFAICSGCEVCVHERLPSNDSSIDKQTSNSPGNAGRTFTVTSGCQSNDNYRLKSVIVHSGLSSDNGHYYCYCCEYSSDNSPNWFLMNDSRITRARVDFLDSLGHTFPRDTPYVCIYEKFNVEENEDVKDLPAVLQDLVWADNLKYLEERKSEGRRRRNLFTFPKRPTEDDDDSFGGSGNGPCGSSSGGAELSGNKFVF